MAKLVLILNGFKSYNSMLHFSYHTCVRDRSLAINCKYRGAKTFSKHLRLLPSNERTLWKRGGIRTNQGRVQLAL